MIVNAATSKTEIKLTSNVSTVGYCFCWSCRRTACSSSGGSSSWSRVKRITILT